MSLVRYAGPSAGSAELEWHARLVEERLRGHGLGGVGREVIGHQLQERVVAHLAPQGIEEQHAFGPFQLDASHAHSRDRVSDRGKWRAARSAPSRHRPIPERGSTPAAPPTNQVSASEAGSTQPFHRRSFRDAVLAAGLRRISPWRPDGPFRFPEWRRASLPTLGARTARSPKDTGRRSWHSRRATASIRAGWACRIPPTPSCGSPCPTSRPWHPWCSR